ncbi:MAG: signal peptide peptidase SppA [Prochlorotrichaceae cyanobacterium]|jgi:protease-4
MIWPFNRHKRKIAKIEVSGLIAGTTRKRVLKALKQVEEEKYPALLLRIDSPGGTVGDSQEIYSALKRLGEKVKIVASFGNISASGGVYIGMGAAHVMANPGTITGSVGVILRGNNLQRLLDKVGVSFKVIKSGPYKDILSFDRDLTEPEQDILQSLIDTSYQQFVETIAASRNLNVDVVKSFADGRIFTGQQAVELGLVDRLGTEEDARRWTAELAGLDPEKAEAILIEEPKPLLNRFLSNESLSLNSGNPFLAALGVSLGSSLLGQESLDWLSFELKHQGQPLWLYHP